MGTPFIATLEPPGLALSPWNASLPPSQQSPSTTSTIPKTFLDAMTIRESVFINEQQIPAENEFDANDARSVHFVIYASINQVVQQEERDANSGRVMRPRKSETRSVPIGTVRIVPFPHAPHPVKGGKYLADELVNLEELDSETKKALEVVQRGGKDRKTTLHDGEEVYMKLGRLAVLKEFRGRGIAGQLIRRALDWMREHPRYFSPSVKERGFEALGIDPERDARMMPKWRGLFCVHAQVSAVGAWQRAGFVVDEEMGRWWEEGIEHVGMFCRVDARA
ncbi:acyl-CoA N-acyltransferase [Neurospora hispaniola]|uniref:Acyl-CoA N-acyltransferase n=1 Tax=Neurospora hispaniola TaxID=588809 RepID=A0AAJ0MQU3_9PEZI|nr:acyl-CoA N-acyltransferase [Neurospora hispaniola]